MGLVGTLMAVMLASSIRLIGSDAGGKSRDLVKKTIDTCYASIIIIFVVYSIYITFLWYKRHKSVEREKFRRTMVTSSMVTDLKFMGSLLKLLDDCQLEKALESMTEVDIDRVMIVKDLIMIEAGNAAGVNRLR